MEINNRRDLQKCAMDLGEMRGSYSFFFITTDRQSIRPGHLPSPRWTGEFKPGQFFVRTTATGTNETFAAHQLDTDQAHLDPSPRIIAGLFHVTPRIQFLLLLVLSHVVLRSHQAGSCGSGTWTINSPTVQPK